MKILFIYFKYPFFIGGSYFQEFLNRLAEKIESVYLLAVWYPKKQFNKKQNIEFFWLPLLGIWWIEDLAFMFLAFIKVIFTKKLHEVDLVNSIGPRGLLAGWYLKKRYKIPLVCTVEIINEKGRLLDNLNYWMVKLLITVAPVDKFICWSNYYWENHLKKWGIAEEKVEIIPGGIDVGGYRSLYDNKKSQQIREKYALGSKLIVFAKPLYTANTESAKLLVKSAALLKSRVKVKFLIGGGEGEPSVRALANKLGVGDLIDFMPPTPFKKIPNYLAAADLIVLPYVYAPTTSRSLLEAMSLEKPIITVAVGEIGKILTDKKNALFVRLEPESIAEAITAVLADRIFSRKIAGNALELVRRRYDLKKIIKRTKEVLQKFSN